MPITPGNYDAMLNSQTLDSTESEQVENVRIAAKNLVGVILANVPTCADQTAAIRKVREAMMTANAAIALRGEV
jgi:hypothetical protein